jgi:hypothetical protein
LPLDCFIVRKLIVGYSNGILLVCGVGTNEILVGLELEASFSRWLKACAEWCMNISRGDEVCMIEC